MSRTVTVKRTPAAVEMRTFHGSKGHYFVIKTDGKFHVFLEVEAKQAAWDCGCELRKGHTNKLWTERWNATEPRGQAS
jgi:hypothetical protein